MERPLASSRPALRLAYPKCGAFGKSSQRTRVSPNALTTAAVSAVAPSPTTSSSKSPQSWRSTDRIAWAITSGRLCVGIRIENSGGGAMGLTTRSGIERVGNQVGIERQAVSVGSGVAEDGIANLLPAVDMLVDGRIPRAA
jgi:hypothetical protein